MINYPIAFEIKFPITSENYKNQIVLFDENFLRIAAKFQLFFIPDIEIEKFIQNYKSIRKKDFFGNEPKCLTVLDLSQFKRVDKYLSKKHFKTRLINDLNKEVDLEFSQFYDFDNTADYYKEDLSDEDFWFEFITISYSTFSDDWERQSLCFKQQLIPRINSFLRDIGKVIKRMEGLINVDKYSPDCICNNGILLDGKIIYQEDIDEGRVKISRF